MRSRFDGNRSVSRHTPSPPRRIAPTTVTVRPRPMWNSHSTLPIESTARPVGFGDVEPSSRRFQPLTKSLHSWRGLSGNGRNSPIVGTERLMNERLATSTARITAIHVTSGASERSRQRLTTAPSPIGVPVVVDADDQLRLAGPPERRQAVAAVGLQVVHLGVADLAQLGDRAAAGEQRREPRDRADERHAPTPTPRGHDR